MDSLKGNTADSVHFKKIEGRWVPVTVHANGSIETNRSIQSISTRRRYLSSDGMNIIYFLSN
jgi:stage V sporulation protein SpoVS